MLLKTILWRNNSVNDFVTLLDLSCKPLVGTRTPPGWEPNQLNRCVTAGEFTDTDFSLRAYWLDRKSLKHGIVKL